MGPMIHTFVAVYGFVWRCIFAYLVSVRGINSRHYKKNDLGQKPSVKYMKTVFCSQRLNDHTVSFHLDIHCTCNTWFEYE